MLFMAGGSGMTLRQFRLELGWNITTLAKEAGVTRQSVALAEKGGFIQADTAKALASALSKAFGRDIKPWEIEGLNIL
jgi:DNA-binding XRE family transcriptional regulator